MFRFQLEVWFFEITIMKTSPTTLAFFLLVWVSTLCSSLALADIPQPSPYHTPPPSLAGKTTSPPPATGTRGYDVLSYDLDITLDPVASSISGRVDVGLQALENDLAMIHLDLVSTLDCLEVSNSDGILFFEHLGDSLLVHLNTPLAVAQIETLCVTYEGRPRPHGSFYAGLMFRKHNSGTNNDPSDDFPIIANVSETWSSHSWWPCKDHPSDKALVSLTASVPDSLSLVSNGSLLSVESNQPGWMTYSWRENFPLPTYLVSVAASNYVGWTENCLVSPSSGPEQNISLGFHVFPHDLSDAVTDLAMTCESMEFLVNLVGPYPFDGEKYDQAEIKWGGAMEHSTATSLPTYFFVGTAQYETLVVHEMAHHWFGNSLTPAVWADIWLNEGFARYCEALWLEHTRGRPAYNEYMNQIGPIFHENMFVGDGLLGDPDPILPNFLVYDKGAWVLHSLRLLLGDDDFFILLNNYATAPHLSHGSTTTADFIQMAELQAGRSLDNFFTPWLYTETVARLSSRVDVQSGGETGKVSIKFQQLQDRWLEMAIPVVLHCGGTDSQLILTMDRRQQEFQFAVDCPVDSVSIDPHSLVFMQMANASSPFITVEGPWPNPSTLAGADFRIYLLESADLSVNIYDVRGRKIPQSRIGWLDATGSSQEPDSTPHLWHFSPAEVDGMAAGVYWLEFLASGHRVVRKTIFIH